MPGPIREVITSDPLKRADKTPKTMTRYLNSTDHVHIWSVSRAELLASPDEAISRVENRTRTTCIETERQYRVALKRFVRLVLSSRVSQDPYEIDIALTAYGKPYLAAFPALKFSLTHTRQGAALAVTQGTEIGLDSEPVSTHISPLEVAQAVCTPQEYDSLVRTSPALQETFFLRLWTAKEACLKALGTGITDDISNLDVSLYLNADGPCNIIGPRGEDYTLTELDLFDASITTLALFAASAALRVIHHRLDSAALMKTSR